jgi:hypothetical protein
MKELHRSRFLAFQSQCGRCYYCRYEMWLTYPEELTSVFGYSRRQALRLKCTAEHLVPRSEGGSDRVSNIVAACLHCNMTRHKRAKPLAPDSYLEIVQSRLERGRWHPFRRVAPRPAAFAESSPTARKSSASVRSQ